MKYEDNVFFPFVFCLFACLFRYFFLKQCLPPVILLLLIQYHYKTLRANPLNESKEYLQSHHDLIFCNQPPLDSRIFCTYGCDLLEIS